MTGYQTPTNFDLRQEDGIYGELKEHEYFSKTTDALRKCFVYTPPGYNPQQTYPVMYLLHGIGGTHIEWLQGRPNEVLSHLITAGEAVPMIAVIPNVRASKDDSVPAAVFSMPNALAFDNFINDLRDDLMPFISKNYNVSSAREGNAIAGLSMGGREALFISFKMPETFGYVGAFSPAPGLLAGKTPHMDFPGQVTEAEMTMPDEYKNTTILINNGQEEPMFDELAKKYCAALETNGLKPEYYNTAGGHDFRVWKNGLYHFARRAFK
ncbi:MAG: alpha/beta hydrolase-fold protein [Defluviitaleaceae bacterium]|nr:alpha/beta hydrolase-fold protein [Defluviitaleaceae bacterium]